MVWQPFAVSFAISLLLVPAMRRLGIRWGLVDQPRQDRWHRSTTPRVGGLVMAAAYAVGLLFASREVAIRWELVLGAGLTFALGLYDDFRHLPPQTKLIGQILAAAVLVFFGSTINFFPWRVPNILLTFVWLVGITNAINLLDNMDGLAAGVALIAAGFLGYFFWQSGSSTLLVLTTALIGSLLGFLIFNYPPAKIFMGDSGSLFLGFSLAALSIARVPRASNVFAVMGVPTLLLLLPILDTSLVTVTRLLRGQSPVQGGRDHTSHRLVAFGLTERQAVNVLYGIALASGVAGTVLESLDYDLSLVLIPVLLVSLSLLAAYLGRLKVVSPYSTTPRGAITRFVVELTFKRRLLEVILDFFLIGLAYYLAIWTRYGFSVSEPVLERFVQALPVAYAGILLAYFGLGVYRGVWRYVGFDDLVRYARAVFGGVVLVALALRLFFPDVVFSPVEFFLFAVFLFLSLAVTRSSFRLLDRIYRQRAWRGGEQGVLLYGAGDAGEIALRWILRNPDLGYRPVGFLDRDPYKWGRRIHGVDVLGDLEQLPAVLEVQEITGVLVTGAASEGPHALEEVVRRCRAEGLWVRRLRFEFEPVE